MMNTLAHSPAEVLRAVLVGIGQGTQPPTPPAAASAWPVYASSEPAAPDNVVTVYDTAGVDDGRSMIDGELFQHYGVQVRVRATTHAAGWAKADAIRRALALECKLRGATVAGSSYVLTASRIGQVLALGRETPESQRRLFTVNALLVVDPVN